MNPTTAFPSFSKCPSTRKKLMNNDRPFIHQGTAPPAAKKVFMLLPEEEKDMPVTNTISAKINSTIRSVVYTSFHFHLWN